jgi:hypothetical protein
MIRRIRAGLVLGNRKIKDDNSIIKKRWKKSEGNNRKNHNSTQTLSGTLSLNNMIAKFWESTKKLLQFCLVRRKSGVFQWIYDATTPTKRVNRNRNIVNHHVEEIFNLSYTIHYQISIMFSLLQTEYAQCLWLTMFNSTLEHFEFIILKNMPAWPELSKTSDLLKLQEEWRVYKGTKTPEFYPYQYCTIQEEAYEKPTPSSINISLKIDPEVLLQSTDQYKRRVYILQW